MRDIKVIYNIYNMYIIYIYIYLFNMYPLSQPASVHACNLHEDLPSEKAACSFKS